MRLPLLFLMFVLLWISSQTARGDALDHMRPAPATWSGHVFHSSFRFPKRFQKKGFPWLDISFRHQPERYLRAVLDYTLEGQDLKHLDPAKNKVRGWFHMPWLGFGPYAREYIHGLTRGRDFAAGELSAAQTQCRQTWAIAFYNDVGGAMLREIWGHGNHAPNFRSLPFLLNTVAVKFVFTQASERDDPLLEGAPGLQAAIDTSPRLNGDGCSALTGEDAGDAPRVPTTLRLLQVDLAVREQRASYKTGWVFGSFRYDGTMPGSDPWKKLKPIGLMWGNDPQLSDEMAAQGSKPQQSIVLTRAPDGSTMGRGGRMNGVADDRQSACSSCHMAAQWPSVSPMLAPQDWSQARCWFRNVDGRYPFGFGPDSHEGCGNPVALDKIKPLDFSLQLAIATRNWALFVAKGRRPFRTAVGTFRRGDHGEFTVDGLPSLPLK